MHGWRNAANFSGRVCIQTQQRRRNVSISDSEAMPKPTRTPIFDTAARSGRRAIRQISDLRADSGLGGATLRAFSVLETAARMRRALSVSELSALADVPKPTMHRL